jgi:hypothetical protein
VSNLRQPYRHQQPFRQNDFSGAMQTATSRLLRKRNEVEIAENAEFNRKIGSFSRRSGYEQVGRTIQHGKDGLGAHIYKFGDNNRVLAATNNSNDTFTVLNALDNGDYWTPVISNILPNTRLNIIDSLEECYVVGANDQNQFMTPQVIGSDLLPVTNHSVIGMPKCKLLAEFNGRLYAINVEVNGVKFKDRAYQSSPAIGAVTFVQGDQQGLLKQLRLDSVRYVKAGMSFDLYKGGTNAKVATALTVVSVDKVNNRISFADTQLTLKDNDELWLTGRKDKLTYFWNTDYPTAEASDWLRVPTGLGSSPEFTGYGLNNNRLFLYTRTAMLKWDGANLITVSPTVGCASHETIKNIGAWTLWLDTTGIWGYNDGTGQLKLLTRGINNYVGAMNQNAIRKASAGVVGRVYKVAVGELLPVDQPTTSTSTSSTSTSSTSSSTSSTSTSSTSTSSTSSSTSSTTTSTSTSSTSTSSTSTSVSSTSTSLSTSSTSTSLSTSSTTTTTLASTKQVVRIVYDFDMNATWLEVHRREIRFQLEHDMTGYRKPYFLDETGRFFRDEVGNKDHNDTIPMRVRFGRNNFGSEFDKHYEGAHVETERGRLSQLKASLDGGDFDSLGQIQQDTEKITFKRAKGGDLSGSDINYEITINSDGEPPIINGVVTYFSMEEITFQIGG